MNRRDPLLIAALCGGLLAALPAGAQTVHARLTGFQEVPAVSTAAAGSFKAKIDEGANMIHYELEYSGLQGTVTQAHIHFGQRGVAGGISVWLCGTATNPGPAGTPTCPSPGGIVTGTIMPANVIGPATQLLAAGEFAELIKAIRSGVTYANVHSSAVPAGEIRGQIRRGEDDDHRGRGGKD